MKKGFTLLELLIVIAILAILAAAAVVVLNPAELLRRARDSERITDLANIRNALNLYLTTVSTIDMSSNGGCVNETFLLYSHQEITASTTITSTTISDVNVSSSRTTDGNGWVPVNLNNVAGGSPLSSLPIDPNESVTLAYYYLCSSDASSTYEIGANMESSNYATGGDDDVEGTDGGNAQGWYEVGNDPALDL